ncbi:MAG TPA: signal peptidase I [Planctomycetota bacterium]|nr:signal peptidase I [Planctomycetota bacterium]
MMAARKFSFSWDDALGHSFVFGVACLTWWLMRAHVLQAYPVRTPSMEPTIEGDADRPDLVLVDKTFDNRSKPKRFDSVVFREWDGSKILVKRAVALPGEYVRIRGFDLWTGASPDSLRRVVKSPVEHGDLLVDYWSHEADPDGFASKLWRRDGASRIEAGRLVVDGQNRRADKLFPEQRFRLVGMRRHSKWRENWQVDWQDGDILIGFLNAFGVRRASSPAAVDFGLRMRCRAMPEASLWIDLRFADSSWAVKYAADGTATLLKDGQATEEARGPDLQVDRDLLFMRLDGGFVLVVDGKIVVRHETELDDVRKAPQHSAPWNGIGIAVTGTSVSIAALTIVQDLHYLEQGAFGIHEAHPVPGDAIFVLGDNSRDSRDSRHMGSVRLDDLLGRPLAILAPAGRRHLLAR